MKIGFRNLTAVYYVVVFLISFVVLIPDCLASEGGATNKKIITLLSSSEAVRSLSLVKKESETIEIIKTLSPQEQVSILSSPGVVAALAFHGQKYAELLEIISTFSPGQQTEILSADGALASIASFGRDEVYSVLDKLDNNQKAQILFSSNALSSLVEKDKSMLRTEGVLNILAKLPSDQQAKILAAPGAAASLIKQAKISEVLTLLNSFTPDQKAEILSTDDTVKQLFYSGKGNEVFEIFKKSSVEQQVSILATNGAGEQLSREYPDYILSLIKTLKPSQQAKVLKSKDVVFLLVKNNHVDDVFRMIEGLSVEQQSEVLSARNSIRVLSENGKEDQVKKMQAIIKEENSRKKM